MLLLPDCNCGRDGLSRVLQSLAAARDRSCRMGLEILYYDVMWFVSFPFLMVTNLGLNRIEMPLSRDSVPNISLVDLVPFEQEWARSQASHDPTL